MNGFDVPPEWTEEALCAEIGADVFFPKKGGAVAAAKAICADCPVREQCLAWALDYESGAVAGADFMASHGIYGGLSPQERRVILRERAAERKAAS